MRAELKREQLRRGLAGSSPMVAVGVHDAMTAKLTEQYGFDAIWVSGFGVSTMAFAMPDLNLLTLTEVLAASQRVDQATALPVIADCDNGFGGVANLVRTVQEFERSGIAGICVEDNQFPKRNSLCDFPKKRKLIPIDEQSRRISEAKNAQETKDFVFIARIESLIAGHGLEDALDRARAYVNSGADAILIHSRDKSLAEIRAFMGRWRKNRSVPVVAVPTLFPSFSVEELHDEGFQLVIFANHAMRAALKATERILAELSETRTAAPLEKHISPLERVFELVKTSETAALDDRPSADPQPLEERGVVDFKTKKVSQA